ncbi:MAG: hypothetical protein ACRDIU_00110 [Actinomycetota bacterium]
MIALLGRIADGFLTSRDYGTLTGSLGAAMVALLIVLLISKEMVRAVGGPNLSTSMRRFNIAVIPLLSTFAIVVAARIHQLLS